MSEGSPIQPTDSKSGGSGPGRTPMPTSAAIKNIERMLAAGTHDVSAQLTMPGHMGVDAVVELTNGRCVYTGATPPGRSMAERMTSSRNSFG